MNAYRIKGGIGAHTRHYDCNVCKCRLHCAGGGSDRLSDSMQYLVLGLFLPVNLKTVIHNLD